MQWIKHIGYWVLLMLVQVLLLDNLHFLGICHPYIYLLFLLTMPRTLPRWAEILVGAVVGLMMDIISNSLGIHMMACTAVSLLRPILLDGMVQDVDRITGRITAEAISMPIFARIIVILVTLHHTLVFMMDAYGFQHFYLTLAGIILSTVLTLALIFIIELTTRPQ